MVLHAEVLVEEWRNPEALALLDAEGWASGRPDPVDVRALMTRGLARCFLRGNDESFRRAEADLEQARRLTSELQFSELAGEVTLDQGTCAVLRDDYDTAETRFREALITARRLRRVPLEAKATGSLGFLRMRTGRFDDAAEWFTKALSLASRLPARVVEIKTLTNLGWCYYTLGDYDRALGFLSRAESMAAAGNHEAERLYALQLLGNTHYGQGALAQAAADYERALAAAREVDDKFVMGELHSNLGIIALEQGRYDEAEASVREAHRIEAEMENLAGRQHSLKAEGEIWAGRGDFAKAEALYRGVLASPDASRDLQWETRAALASLCGKTHRPAEAEEEFRQAFRIMEQSRSELQKTEHKISFFSSLVRFYDGYVDLLVEGGRTPEALELADRSRARLLREMSGPGHKVAAASAEHFSEAARGTGAVLLFYWLAPGRSFLWVVTPRKVEIHVLPAEEEVRRHVEAHQALIQRSRDPLAEGGSEAEWLYRNLVGPAQASIPAGSRVIVVPDGALHRINFETLLVHAPKRHYWIEDVTLNAAPSLALLAMDKAEPRPRSASGILIIGNPAPASDEFPPLAHAATEVQRIAEQFESSGPTVYSGPQADPSVYRRAEPGRFSFIHFAAHAKANAEIPLDSAVILSPKNDSYKLYAREIVDVPLHAELVTLSACRSAGSRTFAGEGLVGLAWAFLSSGARNVIAGLWNVEDASTAELMEELYRGLRQGLRPADALRAAKLKLLRSGTAYRKPFYWAPFVIYSQRPEATGT